MAGSHRQWVDDRVRREVTYNHRVLSVGAGELVVIGLIGLLLIGIPAAIVVLVLVLVKRSNARRR